MKPNSLICLLGLIFLVASCANPASTVPTPVTPHEIEPALEVEFQPDPLSKPPVGKIYFDHLIPNTDYVILAKDVHALKSMTLDPQNNPNLRIFTSVYDKKSRNTVDWLEQRVQYILHEHYDRSTTDLPGPDVIADNYGTWRYKNAQQTHEPIPIQISIEGLGLVRITSPRSGLIRLGPGFFKANISDIRISSSMIRIATLFHEARHSDGHGDSLGFSHVLCPTGHEMAGKWACDYNLNGPYSISASFLSSALQKCKTCSTQGKEVIKLAIFDTLNRVLRDANINNWDDSPEGQR